MTDTSSSPRFPASLTGAAVVAAVFVVALAVYAQYGSEGTLIRDDAVYVYAGQQLARGVPPYQSVFDAKGPVAPLLAGLGVGAAALVGGDDLYAIRVVFLVLSALAVCSVYLFVAALLRSRTAGLLSAALFVGFWGFGRHAFSGPRAKTPALLFEGLALWLTVQRRWFWAGCSGGLAFLTWQPMAIYPAVTFLVAVAQGRDLRERMSNAARAGAGALAPIAAVSVYFLAEGAFFEFAEGLVLFNISYLSRPPIAIADRFARPLASIVTGYSHTLVPILLGLSVVCCAYTWRGTGRGVARVRSWLHDPFAVVLLSFPLAVLSLLLDYQSYPDFYIFLPYAALGSGWLLWQAIEWTDASRGAPTARILAAALLVALVGSATLVYRHTSEQGLARQREWANAILERFGPDVSVASVGHPGLMALLHRTNPTRYLVINNGTSDLIAATTPGGFDGWLRELERADPVVLILGPSEMRHLDRIHPWLESRYVRVGRERPLIFERRSALP